jgi:error-prone DNA polymerase
MRYWNNEQITDFTKQLVDHQMFMKNNKPIKLKTETNTIMAIKINLKKEFLQTNRISVARSFDLWTTPSFTATATTPSTTALPRWRSCSCALKTSATAPAVTPRLCGAMRFAQLARSLDMQGIIGAEITLKGNFHLTLLAKDRTGYRNLCRLITAAHASGERLIPELPPELLPEHASGLIALSGCPQGELAQLVVKARYDEAHKLVKRHMEWFGQDNYYIELQHNLAPGDSERNKRLLALAKETGARVAATGNVHYHVRERHQLQDCLVAIKNCKSLEETHRERRPNSEYYLRPPLELEAIFKDCPEALQNTAEIAGRCTFDLTKDLGYIFPDYPTPEGYTPQSYLEKLCCDAAVRRYGAVTPAVRERLDEEFRLINKYNPGFLLMYHEVTSWGGR